MKKVVLVIVALFAIFTFITTYSAAQEDSGSKPALTASAQDAISSVLAD